jgi:UDP-GlcNAc:undecaprenyl-phosphate GlcNAc-1-phosphate transferase
MDALQFVPILVVGFATSLGLTPLSRAIALRLGVVDKPNQRKIHVDNKPMMGGLAIYVGFALALILLSPPQHLVEFGALISGATFLALVGLVDDRYTLGIKTKMLAEIVATLVLIASGVHVQMFGVPIIDDLITIVWVVALTNAVNFLDNMDGLAAGLSAIAGGFFTLIAFTQGLTLVSSLAAALTGSAVGFLIYNFNPASSFMGDMGALVLGFILATLGIKLEFGTQPLSVTWMVPLLVLALPIFDICLVVFTRIMEGRSPGEAGKDHTSFRLMSLGLSQRWTLFVLYSACLFFGTLGFLVGSEPPDRALLIGLGGLALLAVLFVFMMYVRRKYQLAGSGQPPANAKPD